MKRILLSIALSTFAISATQAMAQAWHETYAWETSALEPYSRTATAITGPIRVRAKTIAFNGRSVPATQIGRYWRVWSEGSKKTTATVYRLSADPGLLRQGNSLCGSGTRARYVVFSEIRDTYSDASVEMAVWSGKEVPYDASSRNLCGTYSYRTSR